MPGGLHPPLAVLETWPEPNHTPTAWRDDHGVFALLIVVYVAMSLVVGARLTARYVGQNFGMDDVLMVVSFVPTTGLLVVCCMMLLKGFDRHAWDLEPAQLMEARKFVFAFEELYVLSSGFVKMSVLCFVGRLSAGTASGRLVWAGRLCMAFVVGYIITFGLGLFFTCRPFSAYWTQVIDYLLAPESFSCDREDVALIVSTVISVMQDFLATALPFTLFWNLKIPKQQKIALGAIFAIGFLSCAIGVYRLVLIYRTFWTTYDVTWLSRTLWIWTVLEVLLGTICASAPALKIFFALVIRPAASLASAGLTSRTSAQKRSSHHRLASQPSSSGNMFNMSNSHGFNEVTVESVVDKKDKGMVYSEMEVFDMPEYEKGYPGAMNEWERRAGASGSGEKLGDMVIRMKREVVISEERESV